MFAATDSEGVERETQNTKKYTKNTPNQIFRVPGVPKIQK
jgi:hypothetical protein